MRIIKKGREPITEVIKTCAYCQTEFGYEKKDIISDFRDGSYIICPNCKKTIAASTNDFILKPKL